MSGASLDERMARRRASRLAAVQALYQIELSGESPVDVLGQFIAVRRGPEIETAEDETVHAEGDVALLKELVLGTCRGRAELDALIGATLPEDWPLERIETVMRAILRVATFELRDRPQVPARVVVSEYVDMAHAFYADKEPGMVNGVLDRLARRLRAQEMEAPGHGSAEARQG